MNRSTILSAAVLSLLMSGGVACSKKNNNNSGPAPIAQDQAPAETQQKVLNPEWVPVEAVARTVTTDEFQPENGGYGFELALKFDESDTPVVFVGEVAMDHQSQVSLFVPDLSEEARVEVYSYEPNLGTVITVYYPTQESQVGTAFVFVRDQQTAELKVDWQENGIGIARAVEIVHYMKENGVSKEEAVAALDKPEETPVVSENEEPVAPEAPSENPEV